MKTMASHWQSQRKFDEKQEYSAHWHPPTEPEFNSWKDFKLGVICIKHKYIHRRKIQKQIFWKERTDHICSTIADHWCSLPNKVCICPTHSCLQASQILWEHETPCTRLPPCLSFSNSWQGYDVVRSPSFHQSASPLGLHRLPRNEIICMYRFPHPLSECKDSMKWNSVAWLLEKNI